MHHCCCYVPIRGQINKRVTTHCSALCMCFSQWKLLQLRASLMRENVPWVKANCFLRCVWFSCTECSGLFCKETRNVTESSTLYALLHFSTGMQQLSMLFLPSALSAGWLSPVIQFHVFGKVCPPICCLVVLSSFTSDCVVSTLITSD